MTALQNHHPLSLAALASIIIPLRAVQVLWLSPRCSICSGFSPKEEYIVENLVESVYPLPQWLLSGGVQCSKSIITEAINHKTSKLNVTEVLDRKWKPKSSPLCPHEKIFWISPPNSSEFSPTAMTILRIIPTGIFLLTMAAIAGAGNSKDR